MARARNIKPGFFANEELAEADYGTRLLFIGLWTIADRAGRLEDRPKRIKMQLFPADDLNVEAALGWLNYHGFVLRYDVDGARYIQVVAFEKHQHPHKNETPSTIPAPEEHQRSTVQAPEHSGLIPITDYSIPDSPFSDCLEAPPPPPNVARGGARAYVDALGEAAAAKILTDFERIDPDLSRGWLLDALAQCPAGLERTQLVKGLRRAHTTIARAFTTTDETYRPRNPRAFGTAKLKQAFEDLA